MNHGVIEQFGTPQEVYDRPATLFVARFIGSPAMNLLALDAGPERGATRIALGEHEIPIPRAAESASGPVTLGVRPEHVLVADEGALRGGVLATEYLGTTQIVTFETAHGEIKARRPAAERIGVG